MSSEWGRVGWVVVGFLLAIAAVLVAMVILGDGFERLTRDGGLVVIQDEDTEACGIVQGSGNTPRPLVEWPAAGAGRSQYGEAREVYAELLAAWCLLSPEERGYVRDNLVADWRK